MQIKRQRRTLKVEKYLRRGVYYVKLWRKRSASISKNCDVLNKLDASLEELSSLDEDTKKHSMKKWIVEKKAIHEIKKIAHEAGKYDKYDEKELEKEMDLLEKFM